MDMETFDEIPVQDTTVGDNEQWITEGSTVSLVQFKGEVIEVVVPSPATYEVVETEPNLKGATAQGLQKPAVLSCGATITVPGYIEQGEMVVVNTEKGEFKSRAD